MLFFYETKVESQYIKTLSDKTDVNFAKSDRTGNAIIQKEKIYLYIF